MNDEPKQHADTSPDATAQTAEGAAGQGMPSLHEVIDKLEAERSDLKDKLLRALADMENMRRRTEKEVADARAYAISKFAADMLGVADNMGRAHKAVPEEARAAADPTLKTLLDGVELVERDMLRALERHGVRQIDPKGEKFDPNFHQAMFELPDPSLPNGTVAQVMQVGYVIGDRVLRPALVGVARGGPKVAPAPAVEPGSTVDKSA